MKVQLIRPSKIGVLYLQLLRVNKSLEAWFARALQRHTLTFKASTLGSWIVTCPHILYCGRPPRHLAKDDLLFMKGKEVHYFNIYCRRVNG